MKIMGSGGDTARFSFLAPVPHLSSGTVLSGSLLLFCVRGHVHTHVSPCFLDWCLPQLPKLWPSSRFRDVCPNPARRLTEMSICISTNAIRIESRALFRACGPAFLPRLGHTSPNEGAVCEPLCLILPSNLPPKSCWFYLLSAAI